jgi:hypothetical protein
MTNLPITRGEWLGRTPIVRSMIIGEEVTNVTRVVADLGAAEHTKGTQFSGCLGVLQKQSVAYAKD